MVSSWEKGAAKTNLKKKKKAYLSLQERGSAYSRTPAGKKKKRGGRIFPCEGRAYYDHRRVVAQQAGKGCGDYTLGGKGKSCCS